MSPRLNLHSHPLQRQFLNSNSSQQWRVLRKPFFQSRTTRLHGLFRQRRKINIQFINLFDPRSCIPRAQSAFFVIVSIHNMNFQGNGCDWIQIFDRTQL